MSIWYTEVSSRDWTTSATDGRNWSEAWGLGAGESYPTNYVTTKRCGNW